MAVFFTSDNHFGHENILKKFCPETRHGRDAVEMNRIMIRQWQSQVQPQDEVYMLGDVFFCKYEEAYRILMQLPGKLTLIYGNHDKVIRQNPMLQVMFKGGIYDWLELKIDKKTVILHHYPTYEWKDMHKGAYHLYGHIHSRYGETEHPGISGRAMDVGIDSRPNSDMTLWSWEEVDRILSKRAIRGHHSEEL